ncbi:hypothetical protein [Lacinutrix venerupis]|uniref:Uncharacterized protein n=1 Tax=Lacinutrix venerupis TaxID=1486034 RepID=A0AAC9PWD5_9FLAO|nr:hypothetical protein [Lacinutrix venerupis]APX99724.1 hypothetical protein BWR22_05170 [Lacinutrix venerupis]
MNYLKISEDYPKSCKKFINWVSSNFDENRSLDLFYYNFFLRENWLEVQRGYSTHSFVVTKLNFKKFLSPRFFEINENQLTFPVEKEEDYYYLFECMEILITNNQI